MKAKDLIIKTMAAAQTLDSDELDKYFIEMGILAIGVLRGVHGDKFVADYLTAALDDKNPIKIDTHLIQ